MIDRRKTAFAIISYLNDPCQVLHISPSYYISDCIYTFISYQQHADYRTPHTYTLEEKRKAARKGPGLDGEPNNFQAPPRLSSLAKLVRSFCVCLVKSSDGRCGQNMDDTLRL